MQNEDNKIQKHFDQEQDLKKVQNLILLVNNTIEPLKKNIYAYLNDKHNNKLNPAIDLITQDDGIRYQQQKLCDLFQRAIYYFKNIQYDYKDEFWQKIVRIKQIDFSLLTDQQKSHIYKNIFHLILDYQARIIQQQRQLFKQKEQAQRVKRINRVKKIQEQNKSQEEKLKQEQEEKKQMQLLETFDKIAKIIQENFDKAIQKLSQKNKNVAYTISKKRRLQKKIQNKKSSIISNKKNSSYIQHPRKPKKPRTGRKY